MFGVKIHPEFQHFALDDARLFPMYEEMARHDMFLIAHMGSTSSKKSSSNPKAKVFSNSFWGHQMG